MPGTTDKSLNTTDVYAIHGADPEVLAYAMAKYSRSALSLRESLREISSQRAEQFLNTFYFQYGHRSIADLAHVAFAIERLSLLAAISLVDEPRWDGQERSTRYQDFTKSGWYTPSFDDSEHTQLFTESTQHLFAQYQAVGNGMLEELISATPRPAEMKEDAYRRTLKARAFDMARYLLPLATNTSLGQITNARTLEQQISRLLTSEYKEIRDLGERLREAAAGPAWNLTHEAAKSLHDEIAQLDPALAQRAHDHLLREVHTSPTLVKYTAPSEYELRSKLLQLRRLYIESLTSVEQLTKLMVESLASFASLFRPVLLLMGVDPPVSKVQCIRETVNRLGLDAEPFERIFALRTSAEQLTDEVSTNQLFASYMRQIERVIDAVDKFES